MDKKPPLTSAAQEVGLPVRLRRNLSEGAEQPDRLARDSFHLCPDSKTVGATADRLPHRWSEVGDRRGGDEYVYEDGDGAGRWFFQKRA